jgi:hypothetical protein
VRDLGTHEAGEQRIEVPRAAQAPFRRFTTAQYVDARYSMIKDQHEAKIKNILNSVYSPRLTEIWKKLR